MEAKLSTHFLSQGWCYGRGFNSKLVNVRLLWPSPSHGLYPASCKTRNQNYSSQNKRQRVKKIHPGRPTNVNSQKIGDEDSYSENLSNKSIPISKDAAVDDVDPVAEVKKSNENSSLSLLSESKSLAIGDEDSDSKNLRNKSIPNLKDAAVDDVDPVVEVEQSNEISSFSLLSESKSLAIGDEDSDSEIVPNKSITIFKDAAVDDVDPVAEVEQSNENSSFTLLSGSRSLSTDTDRKGNLSNVNLQDLIGMIRNAEKNIHLLNQARIRALEDLEKILDEKEALQGEINVLEIKLAETDARLKVAAQEKIHVEVLEDQLEKLQSELSNRGGPGRIIHDNHDMVPYAHVVGVNSFSEQLDLLRKENMSLKSDLQMLRGGLTEMKETNARVQMLEKERSFLESSLRELQAKLAASQEDVSKLSSLRSEYRILYERVDDLQKLLDKATKQADQAVLVLQENHELRKKVEKLEDSLEEANVYKLSSEKMQQYSDLMQQKLKILDERLEKSDEEIYSYVQLYEDSVKDFQETLNILKEGKREDLDEPVNDMPSEFWSRLLLMIDAWLLEKKILTDDAYLLREMVWKREGRICDAYQSCREKNEDEIISTFLGLISSPKSKALHVIHIAAEMAPVAKIEISIYESIELHKMYSAVLE